MMARWTGGGSTGTRLASVTTTFSPSCQRCPSTCQAWRRRSPSWRMTCRPPFWQPAWTWRRSPPGRSCWQTWPAPPVQQRTPSAARHWAHPSRRTPRQGKAVGGHIAGEQGSPAPPAHPQQPPPLQPVARTTTMSTSRRSLLCVRACGRTRGTSLDSEASTRIPCCTCPGSPRRRAPRDTVSCPGQWTDPTWTSQRAPCALPLPPPRRRT